MEQLLSSMLGPIARGLRNTNAFGNSGDIYADTQYRGEPLTMPAPSGGGFAANYTPIRFAPLVSLTGPVMAPATPAAPEAAAPMAPALRLPQMSDMPDNAYMTGEMPQFTGAPIGNRSGAEIRGDLGRIGGFFMSPLSTMASYAMTGKSPMELMAQAMGMGGAQAVQGTPAAPFGGFLQGLQNFLFGPQRESVPLGSSRADLSSQGQGMGFAAFNDAMNAAMSGGASAEMADAAGRAALGLVAQGMDPASAVALASMTALGQVGPDMPVGMGGTPSTPAGMPGLSRNPFDMTAPVAPQAAQTFALGQPNESSYSGSDFGGYGGGVAGETGAPGESSFGLDR